MPQPGSGFLLLNIMAKFRKVHTAFWDDLFIEQLSPEDRYFYLFLLTNPLCTECGIYQISISKICSYTGYNMEAVKSIIGRFKLSKKIVYNEATCEIAIVNKMRYLDRLGKPVLDCLAAELKKVKDISLIKVVSERADNEQIKSLFDTVFTIREKENNDTSAKKHDTSATWRQEEEEEKEKEKEEEEEEEEEVKKIPKKKIDIYSEFVCYDAEDYILKNTIIFEKICIATSKSSAEVKNQLHLYHLWLAKNEKYPLGNGAVVAGIESWILNSKNYKRQYNIPDATNVSTTPSLDGKTLAKKYD